MKNAQTSIDKDAVILLSMLDSLTFGKVIEGVDELLPKEFRGLLITKTIRSVAIEWGYAYYGMREKSRHFPDAETAMRWMRERGISLGMLRGEYDPSLFNGL